MLFLEKAKKQLDDAAKKLKERRDALEKTQNGIAKLHEEQKKRNAEFARLSREGQKSEGELSVARENFRKLEGVTTKEVERVENVEALAKHYTELATSAEQTKTEAEARYRHLQRSIREVEVMTNEQKEHLNTLVAGLCDLRRHALPHLRLMASAFSSYGAMSILNQPMAVVSQVQTALG